MKAKLEQLTPADKHRSFICYKLVVKAFEFVWHYHPEYELTYVLNGKGKRLVGDSYEDFDEGDLVLIGPSVPHTWVTTPNFEGSPSAVVIQFSTEFIGPLLNYKEFSAIKPMLEKAGKGLKFEQENIGGIIDHLKLITTCNDADAFTTLISILQQLALVRGTVLSSNQFKPFKGKEDQQRINKVFSYIQNEYAGKISLQKAASFIYLSDSAFCKFFKRISGKTFSDYVNDIRIVKACELLIETDKPIEQIAFETGFESQTYFNRVFLKKKSTRPKSFRQINMHN